MKNFKEKIIVAALIFLFAVAFAWREFNSQKSERAVFCDVGQGDAALIKLRGGVQAVIDGGASTAVLSCLGKYMPYFDRRVEYVFVSHPDKDHFLGLVEILRRYAVGRVIVNGDESDLPEWREFEKLAASRLTVAYAGDKIKIGGGEVDFLSPKKNVEYKDNNEKSLVFKFLYNGKSILFTGDLPATIEKNLVREKVYLSSDILKVGHHGSQYSSSEEFLRAVHPKFATISVGADNKYGHPNYIILKRLQNLGVKYLRTDEAGDIVVNLD